MSKAKYRSLFIEDLGTIIIKYSSLYCVKTMLHFQIKIFTSVLLPGARAIYWRRRPHYIKARTACGAFD